MKVSKRLFSVLFATVLVSAGSVIFAETKPAAPKAAAPAKSGDNAKKTADAEVGGIKDKAGDVPKTTRKPSARLTLPWKELGSLSDEQKTKILAIHHTALEEKKALEAKEHADILALLTADQKKELKDVETKLAADKKMKKPAKAGDGDEEMDDKDAAPPVTPAAAPASTPKKK